MKIVINDCYGGFGLSEKALEMLEVGNDYEYDADAKRTDAELVKVVEELGEEANGDFAELTVVEIPDEATDFEINEYDGAESITYVLDGKICHVW